MRLINDWSQYYPKGAPASLNIPGYKNIAHTLDQACAKYADKPALTCMGTDLSYRELDRIASRFAGFLQNEAGVKKGDRIAIMLPNIIQFPVVFYAAQKIGAVCVNTNPLYTPREMKHQFKDSGATVIVIIDLFVKNLEAIISDTDIRTVVTTSVGDQLPAWKGLMISTVMKLKGMVPVHGLKAYTFKQALSIGNSKKYTPVHCELDDIAVLQYTGGTTGVSKGAMLTQKNILANMAQIKHVAHGNIIEGVETVLTAIPLYHIFALTVNFLTFLAIGERMILVPKPIPISNTVAMFKKYKITVLTGVNTLYNSLNNDKEFQALAPKTIKFALAGGASLQDSVNKAWQKITGIRIIEGFGLTESSPVTHVNPLDAPARASSIGTPVAETISRIVDPDGNDVAIGEVGELLVRGPQVMLGYWLKEEETKKSLRDGWLWTGDMARMDNDGFFYIVDRKKDMILVSGFNVYPNEVEAVLASHPKVLEAAVVGIPDGASGESVKAFIVAKDKSLTVEELKAHCRDQLTGYKRPRHFELRDALPKTNIGKILRRELRDDVKPQSNS